MDKLVSMRAFAKVVEHGSFSEAAREMRLSRSAVSKYVIDLEQELGVQLLNRTTRSTRPTDNGRLYYERCVTILSDDCLSYGHLATGMQWKLTGKDGDHWLQVPWKLCTNNAEVLRDTAVSGRGIALIPTFIAAPELRRGKLKAILGGYRAPELSVCALYAPTRHLSMKVRVFIDFLVERFGDKPYWDAEAGEDTQN